MNVLLVDNSGENPKMVRGSYSDPKPGDRELLVKIEATALNRADLMQKAGKYPPPEGASPLLGLEMAGVVRETGRKVTRFRSGDAVFGLLPGGGYAEYCVIREGMAMNIPETLTFEEAAAIPEVFLTAWQALVWLGRIKKGERILVHAGGSGVGSAAIQLAAKLFKCEVATTAGNRDKLNTCAKLGAGILINYKGEDFANVISEKSGPDSIDIILDFIGAPYWEKNIEIMSADARLIYLSMLGGFNVENMNLIPVLKKRLTIKGTTLRNRPNDYKEQLTSEFRDHALQLFAEKELLPVIDSVYDWQEVEKAHERMGNNKNTGKIILNGM